MAPEVAGAFTRADNRWLKDYCSYDPQRLRGVGVINLQTPEQMVLELDHLAELGWKAIFLRFWTACEENRLPGCKKNDRLHK